MKLKMAENSLFAVLLRSPWWISVALGVVLGGLGVALLPESWRAAGALSGFPFLVIGALAAWRQAKLPSAARVAETQQAVAAMAWPAFAALLEQAFARDGYAVQRGAASSAVDFVLERRGRRMLVSARRWKSARTGIEALRPLQAARDTTERRTADRLGRADRQRAAVRGRAPHCDLAGGRAGAGAARLAAARALVTAPKNIAHCSLVQYAFR
jgi:restriction system protein